MATSLKHRHVTESGEVTEPVEILDEQVRSSSGILSLPLPTSEKILSYTPFPLISTIFSISALIFSIYLLQAQNVTFIHIYSGAFLSLVPNILAINTSERMEKLWWGIPLGLLILDIIALLLIKDSEQDVKSLEKLKYKMDVEIARKTFEFSNNIVQVDPAQDHIYRYNNDEQVQINQEKPWTKDVHYFTKIKISAVALIKMVMHARSGGSIEVMGLMQGKIDGSTMIIMDAFALPVEGTETRVNAQAEAYEYMVQYLTTIRQVGRLENVVGWYHSHPGYGCWLSGIDVNTQMTNQKYQDPFVAVVIDPNRTVSAGKVEIGAFRTYPEGYKAPDDGPSEYQTIPLSKIEDFGVHSEQIADLAEKLDQTETQLQQSGRVSSFPGGVGGGRSATSPSQPTSASSLASNTSGTGGSTSSTTTEKKRVEESPLSKVTKDR
ncbi:6103_t:CDS:2 [Diversispora eburnea]|uniref:COP9 signalosome complex subunit 5 n=1 Tax=Diversispora eburnea TaxID=1213867 RepID=A0A9N8V7L5_9GLOM|nr:6103_t:CDS:2 [Diversispora eburnea]